MRIRTGLVPAGLLLRGPRRLHRRRAQGTQRDRDARPPSAGRSRPPPPGGAVQRGVHPLRGARPCPTTTGWRPASRSYALAERVHERRGLPERQRWQRPVRHPPRRTREPGFRQPWGGVGIPRRRRGAAVRLPGPPRHRADRPGHRRPGAGAPTRPACPQAEQAAAGKCGTIVQDFTNAVQDGALAGIVTLGNDIANDVAHDPAVKKRHAGLVRLHGQERLHLHQPEHVFLQELQVMYGGQQGGDQPGNHGQRLRQPGAARRGRHRRRLHPVHRPGRDLLRRPGQLRAAARHRQPAGPQRRGPASTAPPTPRS